MTRLQKVFAFFAGAFALTLTACQGWGAGGPITGTSPTASPGPPALVAGHLYVEYAGNAVKPSSIAVYQLPLGGASRPQQMLQLPLNQPVPFSVDTNGNLALALPSNSGTGGTIEFFPAPVKSLTKPAVTIPGGPATLPNVPADAAFDPANNLWVSDFTDVREFRAPLTSGSFPSTILAFGVPLTPTYGYSATKLTFDWNSRLYVYGSSTNLSILFYYALPYYATAPKSIKFDMQPIAFDLEGDIIGMLNNEPIGLPSPVPGVGQLDQFQLPVTASSAPTAMVSRPATGLASTQSADQSAELLYAAGQDGSIAEYSLPLQPGAAPIAFVPCRSAATCTVVKVVAGP